MLSFSVFVSNLITKAIQDWGEFFGILGKAIGSLETWRTKALKPFSKSWSGMQGEEVKRICHEAYSWWQWWQPLLEHFLKSNWCMLYTISKLRKSTIQCFKRCAIRSWNEEVTAIASQSLQAEGSILQSVAKSPYWFAAQVCSHLHLTYLFILVHDLLSFYMIVGIHN